MRSFCSISMLLIIFSAGAALTQSLPEPVQDILVKRRSAGAQLSAVTLPDTFLLSSKSTAPGKIFQMDLDVRFRSNSSGGFILVLHGLPSELCQGLPVDITTGAAAPTTPGRLWYRWTDNYGKIMQQNSLYSTVMIDSNNSLTITVFGFNVDLFASHSSLTGFPASKSGVVISLFILIPEIFAEGTYALTPDPDGQVILKSPVTDGFFAGSPTTILGPIVIRKEPEYNRADVNRDGLVNVFDLLELLKILSGQSR